MFNKKKKAIVIQRVVYQNKIQAKKVKIVFVVNLLFSVVNGFGVYANIILAYIDRVFTKTRSFGV